VSRTRATQDARHAAACCFSGNPCRFFGTAAETMGFAGNDESFSTSFLGDAQLERQSSGPRRMGLGNANDWATTSRRQGKTGTPRTRLTTWNDFYDLIAQSRRSLGPIFCESVSCDRNDKTAGVRGERRDAQGHWRPSAGLSMGEIGHMEKSEEDLLRRYIHDTCI
jgi:hypothetical protein